MRCFAHFEQPDGTVGHCAGRVHHRGSHADPMVEPPRCPAEFDDDYSPPLRCSYEVGHRGEHRSFGVHWFA